MPSWLCSIWKLVANVLGKVLKFVMDVLSAFADLVVDAVGGLVDAVFGGSGLSGLLMWGALALGAYFLLTGEKDDEDKTVAREPVTVYAQPEKRMTL